MEGKNTHNTAQLDAAVGSQIDDRAWRRATGSASTSPIVTTRQTVFVCTQSTLLGFDKSNGRTVLAQSLPGGVSSGPAVADGLVVVPRDTFGEGFDDVDLDTPTLYAVDREMGQRVWTQSFDGEDLGSVVVDHDDLYVQSNREVRRITTDGTTVWRHRFGQSFDWRDIHSQFRPAVTSDAVYVAHRDRLVKLDRATGESQWTRSTGETDFPPVVVNETTLLVSTGDAVVGVHPDDSRVRWRLDESPLWSPAVTDGVAVVNGDSGLLGVDSTSGELEWRADDEVHVACPPVVAGGSVFAGGTTLDVVDTATGNRVDARDVRTSVDWITPDTDGLTVRVPESDGVYVERYSLGSAPSTF